MGDLPYWGLGVGLTIFRRNVSLLRKYTRSLRLSYIGWDGMDLIDLTQDRGRWTVLVNVVMNLRVP
jgi:hypothetical protein